jgi:hypothetical protein
MEKLKGPNSYNLIPEIWQSAENVDQEKDRNIPKDLAL